MRVLMVAACPVPWPRGTPIRVHRMAEALCRAGHDVTLVTYPLGSPGTAVPYRLERVAPGSSAPAEPGPTLKKLLYLDPLLCRAIWRALRRERFDVLHAHHYEGLLATLAGRAFALAPVPLVYDAHTLLGSELPQYRLPLPRRALASVGAAMDHRLPRLAEHVIAVTERMREWFTASARIAPHRVSLIGNGIEHEHFTAAAAERMESDLAPGQVPRILFAGNLAEYQGIALLLRAFVRVRQVRPDAELVFVTDSDPAGLRLAAERSGIAGSVRILPADYALLPPRLATADVLVNPRVDSDGLPQKLLNYMASGRPTVSFAGSAAVLEHGRTGLVVPDSDTDAFAAAILQLLDDGGFSTRLGAAARREVVAAHSWQKVAERVGAVYESLRGGRSR